MFYSAFQAKRGIPQTGIVDVKSTQEINQIITNQANSDYCRGFAEVQVPSVAPSAGDSPGDGTAKKPYKSLREAVQALEPGKLQILINKFQI
jgi:hypothetical protein